MTPDTAAQVLMPETGRSPKDGPNDPPVPVPGGDPMPEPDIYPDPMPDPDPIPTEDPDLPQPGQVVPPIYS